MGELLTGIPVGGLSVGALMTVVFLALVRGLIATRREVDELNSLHEKRLEETRRDRDARLKEKDEIIKDWRDAARASDARADILSAQVARLIESGRTTERVLDSLAGVAQQSISSEEREEP